jgi:hypothetical protein
VSFNRNVRPRSAIGGAEQTCLVCQFNQDVGLLFADVPHGLHEFVKSFCVTVIACADANQLNDIVPSHFVLGGKFIDFLSRCICFMLRNVSRSFCFSFVIA